MTQATTQRPNAPILALYTADELQRLPARPADSFVLRHLKLERTVWLWKQVGDPAGAALNLLKLALDQGDIIKQPRSVPSSFYSPGLPKRWQSRGRGRTTRAKRLQIRGDPESRSFNSGRTGALTFVMGLRFVRLPTWETLGRPKPISVDCQTARSPSLIRARQMHRLQMIGTGTNNLQPGRVG